ncbi:conserved exported hypothetical protein [Candidatus Terasakiella magnetica]|nr:conserved exported hypothetical protein [Candidatus Terasakiella magnetica]
MRTLLGILGVMAALWGEAQAAESVSARLEAAKAAYAKGDVARSAAETEAALAELHARLGKALAEFLPAPPAGWQAEAAETQAMGSAGGGIAVSRAYSRDESSLNAALVLDSPAVLSAAGQFATIADGQPNFKHLKIGAEDAVLRWDPTVRTGEITLVLGNRVLLQIEGDSLGTSELLAEAARGWNVAGIRKYLGL